MLQHSGEMVKAALKERGMAQVELARRTGMDQSLISRYLSGRIEISDKTARHIAEVLEIDFERLRDQLERDRLERKMGRLRMQYKEVIGEEVGTDTSGKRADVGAAILIDSPGVVAVPLLDSIPTDEHGRLGEEVGRYALPPDVRVDAERSFALRVTGEGMTDDKVDEGDIIVVDPVAEVRDGDRVVVMLRNEPALGRIYRRGNTIVLQLPEDRKEHVIFLSQEDDFHVVGRVELCVKRFI